MKSVGCAGGSISETVPDLAAVSRIDGHDMSEAEAEQYLGHKFPALPLHKLVCIGALIAQRGPRGWVVNSRMIASP